MGLRFGRFELLPTERTLLDAGHPVAIGARAFDLLLALIERRDRLVTKAELLDLVWPELVIEEANLPVQVSGLRKIIGAQAIATVPGRGYRFAMAIEGDELVATVDTPRSLAFAARTNIPSAIDLLFGRDGDVEILSRWLAENRLVTVLGAGGIGKTRVAQAAARANIGAHADGVWWVDLAALSSADKIAPAVAAAARLHLGEGDALAQLAQALASRELLLVLDNCEHLAGDVARLVHAVLAGAAGVRVLATSQQALKVDGEHLYMLSSLAVPPVGVSMATARGFAALKLLEHRAQAVDHRFALTDANVGLAVDLCRQLDGVALAIEMAAARLPLLGLKGLHERLGDRLSVLRASGRDTPSRQRTLRATLDWSHELLEPYERAVLRRLAVFPGGFRLDAAQRTTAFAGLEPDAVLDALTGLVEKSLVSLYQLEPPRFRLAETTRLYAGEQLAASGETDEVHRRHVDFMTQFMQDAYSAWLVTAEAQWRHHVEPEMQSLRTALQRALAVGADGAAGIDMAASALPLWSHLDAQFRAEGLEYARLAVNFLDPAELRPITARLWFALALLLPWDQLNAKITALERSIALARATDSGEQLCHSLIEQARILARIGRCGEADLALDEAESMLDAVAIPRLRGLYAMARASLWQTTGNLTGAEQMHAQAADLLLRCGAESLALCAQNNLADAVWARGDLDGAIDAFSRAVQLARTYPLASADTLGVPLGNWAAVLFEQGKVEQGSAFIDEALTLLRKANKAWELCDALSLRLVLKGRLRDAAKVQGYVDAVYASASETRQPNERRLHDQVLGRLREELDDRELLELHDVGAHLTEDAALSISLSARVGC